MPRRGRPPALRGVHAFEEELVPPAELVVDTSFVVDALIGSQPRHEGCRAFLERVAEARSRVFFNRLLEIELWEATFQIALRERHPRDWRRFRHDGRSRRRAERLLTDVQAAWEEVLSALDWVRIEVDEVVGWVPNAMTDWGLSSYDAVHVATALYTDVHAVVTLDHHFCVVPASFFDLYVESSDVRRCRERRS